MRRLMLHLLVALVAFGVGVTAATLLGRLTGRAAPERRSRNVRVVRTEVHERRLACPSSRGLSELPSPPAPVLLPPLIESAPLPPVTLESAPLPPDAPRARKPRIVIQRADGTAVRVVEPRDARAR